MFDVVGVQTDDKFWVVVFARAPAEVTLIGVSILARNVDKDKQPPMREVPALSKQSKRVY